MEKHVLATLFRRSKGTKLNVADPVKRASTFVSPARVQLERISRLSAEVDIGNRLLTSCMPIEAHGRKEAEEVIARAKQSLAAERRMKEIVDKVGPRWQIFNPEPLSWKDAVTGMPVFGVFSVNNPNGSCWFDSVAYVNFSDSENATYQTRPNVSCDFPDVYRRQYAYLDGFFKSKTSQIPFEALKESIWNKNFQKGFIRLGLGAQFAGIIPPTVREEVLLAERIGITDIVILAEVPEWKYYEEISPDPQSKFTPALSRRGDPLVVGHDGFNMWLIDVFDTTTIEQLVADEFATRP